MSGLLNEWYTDRRSILRVGEIFFRAMAAVYIWLLAVGFTAHVAVYFDVDPKRVLMIVGLCALLWWLLGVVTPGDSDDD